MRYDIYNGVINVKSKTQKILLGFMALGFAAALVLSTGGANAITGTYTPFGDAMLVSPGNASNTAAQIRSDAAPGFGGVSFGIPAGTTFASLDTLSTDFMPEADDLCSGGSPRFSIGIDTTGDGIRDGSIFAYFGPDSGSPICSPGVWQNTTDLLDAAKLLDTSQLPGGTFYQPYPTALTNYGGFGVTSISVVVDSSWIHPDGEQTFLIDNTNTDGTVYTYEPPPTKDDCKKGGWATMTNPGPFKNQGDCVSYFATNGRNLPSGN